MRLLTFDYNYFRVENKLTKEDFNNLNYPLLQVGGVAQMVERLLSMREAMGSMPIISTFYIFIF